MYSSKSEKPTLKSGNIKSVPQKKKKKKEFQGEKKIIFVSERLVRDPLLS